MSETIPDPFESLTREELHQRVLEMSSQNLEYRSTFRGPEIGNAIIAPVHDKLRIGGLVEPNTSSRVLALSLAPGERGHLGSDKSVMPLLSDLNNPYKTPSEWAALFELCGTPCEKTLSLLNFCATDTVVSAAAMKVLRRAPAEELRPDMLSTDAISPAQVLDTLQLLQISQKPELYRN